MLESVRPFWWRWDYRHTNSLSRYPVPAHVKLLPYGATEIWLFFFLLLLCLNGNVIRRSKDCFNTMSTVNWFKLGFSFCWAFFLTGCRSDGISLCWAFVLTGFRSTGPKPSLGLQNELSSIFWIPWTKNGPLSQFRWQFQRKIAKVTHGWVIDKAV